MMMEDAHVFQGMRRDNHPIKQDSKFLWDAHNIRLTNREDNTLLSLTNEKGTSGPILNFTGYYLGHCVLNKYLVIFTTRKIGNIEDSYIYRVEETDTGYNSIVLFNGQLNLSVDNPIETIGIYETDLIQKVYWIDGKNQPRVINIKKKELQGESFNGYLPGEFDFVQTLQLKETVSVTKNFGSGIFSPGTIQYALTYYNKYGQETNIFYTTPIQYISFQDRAGSPEDRVANSFTITVKNLDTNFEYMRVYSIHRTSIDAVPTVKMLNDISLTNPQIDEETQKPFVTFTDFGNTGVIEDPTKLLYVGGRDIVPQCFTHKDGTLFLGNIELKSYDSSVVKELSKLSGDAYITKNKEIYKTDFPNTYGTFYINDKSSLNEGYNAGFKANETYRLGIQAQLDNGVWSEPVLINDTKICTNYPTLRRKQADSFTSDLEIVQYGSSVTVPDDIIENLKALNVKKLRLCVVFPQTYERDIICQGIINPTVYNGYNRSKNAPFSQASWFFRPAMVKSEHKVEGLLGGNIEFRHNYALDTSNYGHEIQSMLRKPDGYTIDDLKDPVNNRTDFFVDENIVTFNSPDIEFDDNLIPLDYDGVSLRILGYVELSSIYGDISLTTSTPTIGIDTAGFQHSVIGYNSNTETRNMNNGGLVSQYMYNDALVELSDKAKEEDRYKATKSVVNYKVHTWHRSTSMNNDVNRPDDKGVRTSELDTKIISNLKVFRPYTPVDKIYYGDDSIDGNILKITKPQIFSSDVETILKFDVDYLNNNVGEKIQGIYQGNIDTLLSSKEDYPIYYKVGTSSETTNNNSRSKDPIRMKYKSSPHIMFRFEGGDRLQTLIPRHINSDAPKTGTQYGEWIVDGNPADGLTDKEIFENDPLYKGDLDLYGYTFVKESSGADEEKLLSEYVGKSVYGKYNDKYILGTVIDNPLSIQEVNEFEEKDYCIVKVASWTDIYTDNVRDIEEKFGITDGTDYSVLEGGHKITLNKEIYINIYRNGNVTPSKTSSIQKAESNDKIIYVDHQQAVFGSKDDDIKPYLLIGELVTNNTAIKFGGNTEQALQNNMWLPASDPIILEDGKDVELLCKYGDTWYGRYDCLKTYPFTEEDPNQLVEIGSFMCETRVNLNGRYDRNKGELSNIYSRPTNFNLINPIYSQQDNFFNYRAYDKDYYKQNVFANQITWTLEKVSGADIDNWTNITLSNTLDLNGSSGGLNALAVFNDTIIALQDKAINKVNFNSRVQIPVSDGVPIEISNGYKVDGYIPLSTVIGCANKWSVINTVTGLYFIDPNTDNLIALGEGLSQLSKDRGLEFWSRRYSNNRKWLPDNTISNNGVRSFYDSIYGDVYFTPGSVNKDDIPDALCFSEVLGQFTSFMSYEGTQAMFNFNDGFYSLRNKDGAVHLYKNNAGNYNEFYGEPKGWSFSFISNENPTYTKIFDTVELRTDHYWTLDTTQLLNTCPMDFIKVSNEYQKAESKLNKDNMRKKFRVWRGFIPRASDTSAGDRYTYARARIRNPWAQITLGWTPVDNKETEAFQPGMNTKKAVIHDVTVKYTI